MVTAALDNSGNFHVEGSILPGFNKRHKGSKAGRVPDSHADVSAEDMCVV